jgi:hypothetical protein
MRRVDQLLAPLRAQQAPLAGAIDAMLAAHKYRELCALLEPAAHLEAR